MQTHNGRNPKVDDMAYMITVLAGPFSLLTAALIALIAATVVTSDTRSKDLMQFATLLFGGGAAVTGTVQPRRSNSTTDVTIDANEFNSTTNVQSPVNRNESASELQGTRNQKEN
jgi:hypothetical protein